MTAVYLVRKGVGSNPTLITSFFFAARFYDTILRLEASVLYSMAGLAMARHLQPFPHHPRLAGKCWAGRSCPSTIAHRSPHDRGTASMAAGRKQVRLQLRDCEAG